MPGDVFHFTPGRCPGLVQSGACAVLMPAKFCRPVPGDRLDDRPTCASYVCHVCVIIVSCFVSYLCHNCVMFCVIFVSFMNKSLIFRPGDRPTAKRPKKSRLDFYVIYNIKIKKPRLHARAPHARLTRARTRPPARLTRACVK